MNWRQSAIRALLTLTNSKILRHLRTIQGLEKSAKLETYTQEKLKNVLLHAYQHVPYYTKVLRQAGVVENDDVQLENWNHIPILTKATLRKEFHRLQSDDLDKRKWFVNHSGGSTGEPSSVIQDKTYAEWNIANKLYYKSFGRQEIGEPELRLWSSEAEVLEGKEKLSIRLRNWLYDRTDLNTFRMTKQDMESFARLWNEIEPSWVEGYALTLHAFAQFVRDKKLRLHSPKGIISSAEALQPNMQRLIEKVFKTKVYNRYGSREVGDIACSCQKDQGLHLSVWNNFVEILDEKMRPCKPGKPGKLYVTNLNNYAMPLIRYEIGDVAVPSKHKRCACGRKTPMIDRIEGRVVNMFRTKKGDLVSGGFFVHFVGSVFNTGFIKKFQVIQKKIDHIVIKVVLNDKNEFLANKAKIESEIRKMMGECRIEWKQVRNIPASKSGKFLYTISEVMK